MTNLPPLQEKDFIQEEYSKNPYPFWFWLVIITLLIALFWGFNSWYSHKIDQEIKDGPFLQVTNREFSLFLWQNPEYMRVNSEKKSGYLPGFQYLNQVNMEPKLTEDYVQAPPELLFLYHTWNRLISQEFPVRSISVREFLEFLDYANEWQPKNWHQAPHKYRELVDRLYASPDNQGLQVFQVEDLPPEVLQAFIGWKNYFKEGNEINTVVPTYGEMQAFLKKYPHYARNYWENIVGEKYLRSMQTEHRSGFVIPKDELTPFLRSAFYNYKRNQTTFP